jgi:hypothetical protein
MFLYNDPVVPVSSSNGSQNQDSDMCNQCSANEEPDIASEKTLQEDVESSMQDDFDIFEREFFKFDDFEEYDKDLGYHNLTSYSEEYEPKY